MPRLYVDCREMPSESGCTLALSADSRDELLEAAAAHAVAVHGHTDGPELRDGLAQVIHEEAAPV
jgi:predicted small metal-binding protein